MGYTSAVFVQEPSRLGGHVAGRFHQEIGVGLTEEGHGKNTSCKWWGLLQPNGNHLGLKRGQVWTKKMSDEEPM